MNELQYIINAMARSEGYTNYTVEGVELNKSFAANVAAFDLLAAVASTFYIADFTWTQTSVAIAGGVPQMGIYDLAGVAQVRNSGYLVGTLINRSESQCRYICSRLRYDPNGCTSAVVQHVGGIAFKVTSI